MSAYSNFYTTQSLCSCNHSGYVLCTGQEFLKAIRERTGPLQTCWFMSDDANQYFNAWKGVFHDKETKKLLCAWHVDRAWRTALNQHVNTKQSRIEIYHQLRILLMENEEAQFRNCLSEWASYFRIGSVVNTNMFLESFHRTLKVVYLQHKHNRRIDYLLHTLLKIARDKVFEQLTKLEKGKFTHRVSEINKRQKEAQRMESLMELVHAVDDNTWSIPSARDGSVKYTIKQTTETCDCKLRCSTCATCIHVLAWTQHYMQQYVSMHM